MTRQQYIATPYGVSVRGSAIIRVMPDVAVLRFSVSRLKPHPKEAFQAVREASQQVQKYLAKVQVKDAGSSNIGLREEVKHIAGENKLAGYRTWVEFRVMLSDLTRVEDILSGVIEAGANNIQSVSFQTTRLKELRADVRRQAILAARETAEVYCQAAGVELGDVIHIEDFHREEMVGAGGSFSGGAPQMDEEGTAQAFDPSTIVVAETVLVAFKIKGQ